MRAVEYLERVVKLLLERGDVDLDLPNTGGRTPLSFAAECGVQSVAKMLLESGDVNPNTE